jgi:hypothetical protein
VNLNRPCVRRQRTGPFLHALPFRRKARRRTPRSQHDHCEREPAIILWGFGSMMSRKLPQPCKPLGIGAEIGQSYAVRQAAWVSATCLVKELA